MTDYTVLTDDGDDKPACRHCRLYLVECPRGEDCTATQSWQSRASCVCLRGSVCPLHGPYYGPAR